MTEKQAKNDPSLLLPAGPREGARGLERPTSAQAGEAKGEAGHTSPTGRSPLGPAARPARHRLHPQAVKGHGAASPNRSRLPLAAAAAAA